MTNIANTSVLMEASNQWSSRPADERYTSLLDMEQHFQTQRRQSRALVASNRAFTVAPYAANPDGSQGAESTKAMSLVSKGGQHRNEVAALRTIARRTTTATEAPLWWDCLKLAAFLFPAAWVLL